MNDCVKIRKIEMDILNLLRSGARGTHEIAAQLNQTYSAIHSVLNRMVMYFIVERRGNGVYIPLSGNFIVASDAEVIAYRRKKKDRFIVDDSDTVMNISMDTINFIRKQYAKKIERSEILSQLREKGVKVNKFILNHIIYTYGIDREFPERNRLSDAELVTA